jgi:hypothetical protein
VHQNHGERSFHIFYQLVEGGEEDLLRWLGLERNCQRYSYLVQVGEVTYQHYSYLVQVGEVTYQHYSYLVQVGEVTYQHYRY